MLKELLIAFIEAVLLVSLVVAGVLIGLFLLVSFG